MPIIQQSIKNLKGGISQQPDSLRYPDQGAEQVNGWTSETTGLQKRPPVTYVGKLAAAGAFGKSPYIHLINRDETEQYYVVFTGSEIKVFDLAGKSYKVDGDLSYIKSASPRDDLRMVTVADYTFIINRKVVVDEGDSYHNDNLYRPKGRALINVRGGQYGRELAVGINGEWCDTVVLPDGREPEHSKQMDAVSIAKKLVKNLEAKFPSYRFSILNEGVIVVESPIRGNPIIKPLTAKIEGADSLKVNSIIVSVGDYVKAGQVIGYTELYKLKVHEIKATSTGRIYELDSLLGKTMTGNTTIGKLFDGDENQTDGEILKIETKDGYNNQLINGIISTVQTFNKLPATAPDGYIVEILNDPSQSSDGYFVKYSTEMKAWKECPKWNLKKGLDAKTLCHALRRNADNTFSLVTLEWNDRVCGDEDTNPMPSFVGNTLNDVFFYRNRLGFLSGENVILSRTGRYYNFFPQSVATLSDDDPIDVAVSNNRISILQYAVPFNDELLLWSDEAQFVLTSGGILSSKTVELNLTSEFDVSDKARPFSMGRGVYFAAPRANHTSIKRYYAVQDVSEVKDAEDISSHVPRYIPNGVYSITGSGTENFCSILTSGAQHQLFIYKFYYSDSNLMIQSWSHWDFGEGIKILAAGCISSEMYLIFESKDAIWLGRMNFTGNTVDFADTETYRTFIDHKIRVKLQGTYDINLNETTVKYSSLWSHTINDDRDIFLVDSQGVSYRFEAGQKEFKLQGNRVGQNFMAGFAIPFRYEFSKFLIKKMAEDGSVATEDTGRLQLQRAWVTYEESGGFDVTVYGKSHQPQVYTMSGRTIGDPLELLSQISINSGRFQWSIGSQAEFSRSVITSDKPTPLSLIGAGWEGRYVKRSQGI
ncbi:non-contractile tail tubular protein Gp12 [Providencia phage PSTCR2]|uniref:Non-contractile tail tubular protein Gp12 n=1 Tax=Providencia phage PSTCR2 TaxID=2783544 RepID=A0A873WHA7_9CAUD|nr:non-contractile tail tubular protein Gp12 [Providencia phage PSTCR2]